MKFKRALLSAVVAVSAMAIAADAQAFWGSRGGAGSYGSGGGWGSYGGGGWGSHGGGWGSRGGWGSGGGYSSADCGSHGGGFLSRIFSHRRGGSHGSSGGYGSHGSHGGYSHGSSGSHGGYGSHGGGHYGYQSYEGSYARSESRGYETVVSTQRLPEFVAQAAPKTKLTLRVPADAKVTLAGVEMKQSGEVRQFSTTKLPAGESWGGYTVVIEATRDGQTLREERAVTLTGGESQEMAIDFASAQLAQL